MVAVAPWEGGHMGAAAEAMVVGICMVFVRVVGCELCFFVVRATFVMVGTLHIVLQSKSKILHESI
jgi:hypothetical protein